MWYAKKTSADQGLIVDDETGRTVAVSYDAEDSPLLAAAPELLAALELAQKELAVLRSGLTPLAGDLQRAEVRCRLAIAKATGQ